MDEELQQALRRVEWLLAEVGSLVREIDAELVALDDSGPETATCAGTPIEGGASRWRIASEVAYDGEELVEVERLGQVAGGPDLFCAALGVLDGRDHDHRGVGLRLRPVGPSEAPAIDSGHV